MIRLRLYCIPALALVALGGCDELSPRQASSIHPPGPSEEGLPEVAVDLPEVPPLTTLDVPATYPDGTHSVSGILMNRVELRDQPVTLTAILGEIYLCETAMPLEETDEEEEDITASLSGRPDEEEEEDDRTRAGCLLPHFYAVDNTRSDQRMLVVGYDWNFYEPQLEQYARYVIEGTYSQRAPGFTSTEYGLIVASRIEGDTIEFPEEEIEGEEGEEDAP